MIVLSSFIKCDSEVNSNKKNEKVVTDSSELKNEKVVTDSSELKNDSVPSRNLRQKKKEKKKTKKVKQVRELRSVKRIADTCDLTMELFPFFYIPIIRSTQFRIAFSSACMRKRDFTFRVFYNDTRFINYNHHPTKVKLDIFGNKYEIDYSNTKMIDEFDIMKSLVYQTANVKGNKNSPKNIDINNQNDIFLDPHKRNIFNPYNIRRLSSIKGAVLCTTEIRRDRGWKVLKAMREKYGENGGRKLLEQHKKKVKEVLKRRRKLVEKKLNDKDRLRMANKEMERQKLWVRLEENMQNHYIREINILCKI